MKYRSARSKLLALLLMISIFSGIIPLTANAATEPVHLELDQETNVTAGSSEFQFTAEEQGVYWLNWSIDQRKYISYGFDNDN